MERETSFPDSLSTAYVKIHLKYEREQLIYSEILWARRLDA